LGGKTEIQLDVRVLASTNAPLDVAIREGRFREDLFYRLNVFPIPLPPLRERKDDIPALLAALLETMNRKHHTRVTDASPEALDRLMAHSWPGNVRELRNVVERATILAAEGTIRPEHLPPALSASPASTPASALASALASTASPRAALAGTAATTGTNGAELHLAVGATVEQAERALIELTLEHTKNNKTRAAEILGISQKTLFNKLKEYGTHDVPGL
jgi:DNA-binding NtrC family response regulator